MGKRNGWKWQPNYNRLAVQVGGTDVAYFGSHMNYIPLGRTYYVNIGTSGNDSNAGITPDEPLRTIEAAIALCTDDADDYIFVMDCWDADTYTITVNKSRIHIIGISLPSPWSYATLNGGGDNVLTQAANYIEIAGFSMISAAANGLVLPADKGFGWFHHLNFAAAAASLAIGISCAGGSGTNSMIEDCYFGYQAANITDHAIAGGLTQSTIRNCVFMQITNACIELSNNNCRVLNNFFHAPIASAEAVGWAVHLLAGSSGNMVIGNRASQTGDGTGNNPFRDSTTGNAATCTNGWADNFDGPALIASPDVS